MRKDDYFVSCVAISTGLVVAATSFFVPFFIFPGLVFVDIVLRCNWDSKLFCTVTVLLVNWLVYGGILLGLMRLFRKPAGAG